jgi:hypothetical protein
VALLLFTSVFTRAGLAQTPPPDDSQQVIAAFELARGAGDVDATLAQFADDAVVTVQGRTSRSYEGKEQVRKFLQTVGVQFQTLMHSSPLMQGDSMTWTERDKNKQVAFDATVVATVRMGRITSLIYRTTEPFGSTLGTQQVALEQAPAELPSFAWAAGLALVGLALLAVVFGRPRRPASQSQLDGRLLLELRRQRELEGDDRAA